MDHWYTQSVGSGHNREPTHQSRVLTSISGNAQSFPVEAKSHFDFNFNRSVCATARAVSEPQYVAPPPVYEFGHANEIEERLAARKIRRGSHPPSSRQRLIREKAWLKHPIYRKYLNRKRQDNGRDGKPVWPDYIEESFQNALIHIPPMGKKKKTQYGRHFGRNELIKEWIYQETGENRDRKQVSSHIQVLSNLLKDIPEWKELTAGNDDERGDITTKAETGPDFYFESIADQVRLQRQLAMEAAMQHDGGAEWSSAARRQRFQLARITFDMYVLMPDSKTEALHNYTRITNKESTPEILPLENYKNWREQFPDLEKVMNASPSEDFELIFLKSKFSLMTDFPPLTSKLGLTLDLEYPSNLSYFTSVNHMYLNGKCFRKTEHKISRAAKPGMANLFFDAEWWATQFTDLIGKRKAAEDSGRENALAAAEDFSRTLFRELSIMQEVFAYPSPDADPMQQRRIGILLWIFAQTNTKGANITTWHKVVPPPSRYTTNSPAVKLESSLPPLVMDTMLDSSFNADVLDGFSQHEEYSQTQLPLTVYEPSSYHTGLTPLQTSYNYSMGSGFTPRSLSYIGMKQEPFNFALPTSVAPYHVAPPVLPSQNHIPTIFDGPHQEAYQDQAISLPEAYQASNVGASCSMEQPTRCESLANFDMSTHNMLQAQLADFEDTNDIQESVHQVDADSQHSVSGHMNDLDIDEEQLGQVMNATATETMTFDEVQIAESVEKAILNHPSIFDSPRIVRPPLMAHNSFAGTMPTSHDTEMKHDQLIFDTPTRHEFARLMDKHIHPNQDDDLFGDGQAVLDQLHFPPSDFTRPRSQPVLPSNDSSMHLDTPKRLDSALP
ncbi:hypothetical protein LTR64_008231 [Lithohypha guttulata]|uniref:uncharacterized protein n=1 Tax=Lithohypha guttulata TaxID=1690604 RepID=UPI002DDE667F|nr:hypothetical protein LTR51_008383 [Lithohypha guttulata]